MTTDRDPTFEGKRTEQGNVQPPSRVESQASGRAHPDAPSKAGVGTILTSCVLAFLMGGAGAWAYVDYLGPMLARNRAQKSQPDVQNSESNSTARPDGRNQTGRLGRLRNTKRLRAIQSCPV